MLSQNVIPEKITVIRLDSRKSPCCDLISQPVCVLPSQKVVFNAELLRLKENKSDVTRRNLKGCVFLLRGDEEDSEADVADELAGVLM